MKQIKNKRMIMIMIIINYDSSNNNDHNIFYIIITINKVFIINKYNSNYLK